MFVFLVLRTICEAIPKSYFVQIISRRR